MEYFDTPEYVIQRYEDELPDMLLGAHEDYEHGNLDKEGYADTLRRIYTLLELLYLEGGKIK